MNNFKILKLFFLKKMIEYYFPYPLLHIEEVFIFLLLILHWAFDNLLLFYLSKL